jgi:hypothetical protein
MEEFFLCYWAGGNQWVSGWRLDGTMLAGFPKLLYAGSQLDAHSSVHLGDLEGDGDLDLCAQGGTFGAGRVCVYEVDGSTYNPQTTRADWPKIRRDLHNTGYYPGPPDPAAVAAGGLAEPRLACFPDPAALGGSVRLSLPGRCAGVLQVFDLSGRMIGRLDAGGQGGWATFATRDLLGGGRGTGVYFLRFAAPSGSAAATRLTILGR